MKSERGQGLIEAVAAVPVCLVCALAIVDCGVVLRDRIAVSSAASRAAAAHVVGGDAAAAARAAAPGRRVVTAVRDSGVVVTLTTRPALLGKQHGIELRSSVALPEVNR